MRVPEKVFKCVAFVGAIACEDEHGKHGDLDATGFFVSVRSKRFADLQFVYFVTAKHVADELIGREVYIQVNTAEGGITRYSKLRPAWWFHPTDPKVDVAAIQVAAQPGTDIEAINVNDFATHDDIGPRGAAFVGDEVFITGLFTLASGVTRNLPIVRHGNIAMLPEEQIQTELGYCDVYLVEARSIGGLSGSPVFVRPTMTMKVELQNGEQRDVMWVGDRPKLLGLMQGHWDVAESQINSPHIRHDQKKGVNLGIGIVIPAYKIFETIMQLELVKLRDEGDEDLGRLRSST